MSTSVFLVLVSMAFGYFICIVLDPFRTKAFRERNVKPIREVDQDQCFDQYKFGCQPTKWQQQALDSTADIVICSGKHMVGKTMLITMAAKVRVWVQTSSEQVYAFTDDRDAGTDLRNIDSSDLNVFSVGYIRENAFQFAGTDIHTLLIDGLNRINESTFWYLVSRLKSFSHVKPKVFCTADMVDDSIEPGFGEVDPRWITRLLSHWKHDPDNEPGIRGRRGGIRYFQIVKGQLQPVDITKPDCLLSEPISIEYVPAVNAVNPFLNPASTR